MPQPAFLTTPDSRWRQRQIVRFGNMPVYPTSEVMPWIDLNSGFGFHTVHPKITPKKILLLDQMVWQGEAVVAAVDYGETKIKCAVLYDEQETGLPMQQARNYVLWGGLQWLTFDNLTGFQCHVTDMGDAEPQAGDAAPYLWRWDMEFQAPVGVFQDMSQTSLAAQAVTANNPAVTTSILVNYAGSWWTKPVWTLTIPNNTVSVSSIVIANTTSSETLTVTLPLANPANTALTLTIDSSAKTIVDQNGKYYDFSGTFPRLWPRMGGGNNTIQVTLGTPSAGVSAGITFSGQWTNRWSL